MSQEIVPSGSTSWHGQSEPQSQQDIPLGVGTKFIETNHIRKIN